MTTSPNCDSKSPIEPQKITALVTKSTGSWYWAYDRYSDQTIECRLRGSFRLRGSRATNPVVVGDRVIIEQGSAGQWTITEIEQRKNYIIRRASNLSHESHIIAANIDRVYIVATIDTPPTAPEFIDRVLVTAEAYKIPATILVNKIDLLESDQVNPFTDIYTRAGYEVIPVSAAKGIGIEDLRKRLANEIVLFTGNSGVGKSTLINAIDPNLNARVGEISDYHNRGRHTTTFSEIFPLTGGGFLIDTPGVKGFGLVDIKKEELYRYFRDLMSYSAECGFYNCTHIHEPKCAVIKAVVDGHISESRYESYLKMMEDDTKHR